LPTERPPVHESVTATLPNNLLEREHGRAALVIPARITHAGR
jgi:hypothetical protein